MSARQRSPPGSSPRPTASARGAAGSARPRGRAAPHRRRHRQRRLLLRDRRARCSAWSASRARARRRSAWRCSATPGAGSRSAAAQVLLDGVDLLTLSPRELRDVARRPGRLRPPGPVLGAQSRAADRHPAERGAEGAPGRGRRPRGPDRRGAARGAPRRHARVPAPLPPSALRRRSSSASALAMAFACRPSLIVLDEPTTGLDVTTQRHVLETIRSLCRCLRRRGRLREPRPRRGRRAGQRRRRPVRRPDHRARADAERVRLAAAPLHPRPAGRGALARAGHEC